MIQLTYRRLSGRIQRFEQPLLHETGDCFVTFLPSAELSKPLRVGGEVVLEEGSPVVWFTFPGKWHDVGRFHRADGSFTGLYANILTPVEMDGNRWSTTDLCLDLWMGADGKATLLDEEELREARVNGWVDEDTAARAEREGERLLAEALEGTWPPSVVREWTLERARERM